MTTTGGGWTLPATARGNTWGHGCTSGTTDFCTTTVDSLPEDLWTSYSLHLPDLAPTSELRLTHFDEQQQRRLKSTPAPASRASRVLRSATASSRSVPGTTTCSSATCTTGVTRIVRTTGGPTTTPPRSIRRSAASGSGSNSSASGLSREVAAPSSRVVSKWPRLPAAGTSQDKQGRMGAKPMGSGSSRRERVPGRSGRAER